MLSRRQMIAMAAAVPARPVLAAAEPGIPPGYPRSYSRLIDAAAREKALVLYTTMFPVDLRDAVADFGAIFPFLKIEYSLLRVDEASNKVVQESSGRAGTADMVWLSTMDAQVKLINDGYAAAYNSPEKPNIPDWAVWKNEGWAITAEPAVLIYNKKLVPEHDVPHSRDELEKLLRAKPADYRGKIGTYSAPGSSVGFLLYSEDIRITRDTWSLIQAIAESDPILFPSSEQMVNAVRAGDIAIAYNVLGTHAFEGSKEDSSLGVVLPAEYTQMVSNIAFIPREAAHPSAARLFLDYLLSERGQNIFARRSYTPVNINVRRNGNVPHPDEATTHAVRMGPGLLANVDSMNRAKFVDRWKRMLKDARIVATRLPDGVP